MKIIFLALISLVSTLFVFRDNSKALPYTPIGKEHSLLWQSTIGRASFRTNLCAEKSFMVIGSNGEGFRDGTFMDKGSGVYFIAPQNGNILRALDQDKWGDFDVNGTVVYNNKVYYGNDNEEFICRDLKGNIIWKNLASGDVEAEPVLLDISGRKAIVYATELGEVRAVEPQTGRTIWTYFTPDFSGWKEGDSRMVFKVKAFLSGTMSFFTKPTLADVNKDGVSDLVYCPLYGDIICISGSTGKLLWTVEDKETSYGHYVEYKKIENLPEFWVASSSYDSETQKNRLAITRISEKGKVIGKIPLQESKGFGFSLNSLTLGNKEHLYATDDSLYWMHDKGVKSSVYIGDTFRVKYEWYNEERIENRVSSGQLFGSGIFRYKGQDSCIVLLSQYDGANYDTGFISIISLPNKRVVARYALPGSGEMPPQVGDFNRDGIVDLLVNCADNKLYCYQLN
jgi:hypothetical protein